MRFHWASSARSRSSASISSSSGGSRLALTACAGSNPLEAMVCDGGADCRSEGELCQVAARVVDTGRRAEGAGRTVTPQTDGHVARDMGCAAEV